MVSRLSKHFTALGEHLSCAASRIKFQFGKKERFSLRNIDRKETESYLRLCSASTASHGLSSEWLEGTRLQFMNIQEMDVELLKGVLKEEHALFDPKTGLKMTFIKDEDDPNKCIVSFGAVNSLKGLIEDSACSSLARRQRFTVLGNFLGFKPKLYREALRQFEKVRTACPDVEFELTGQSLGGSLAAYVSLKTHTPSTCFNPAPLGVGLQHSIGKKSLGKAKKYVTIVSAKSDLTSAPHPVIRKIDSIISAFRIRTPGLFGARNCVPTAYKKAYATHSYCIGSIMQHLGYNKRDKPSVYYKQEGL